MKKITYLITIVALALFVSCKNETKSTDSDNSDASEMNTSTEDNSDSTDDNSTNSTSSDEKNKRTYIVSSDSTTVKWTAYKTTSKIAVGGEFSKINFESRNGSTISEAFNNLKFSIPISSLFTDNEDRDKKLIASFFDILLDTKNITGKLSFDSDDLCSATITMNDISKKIHISYFAAENEINFTADLNLEDWDATDALEILNTACGELHKGTDGKSKTWSEIAIHINVKY